MPGLLDLLAGGATSDVFHGNRGRGPGGILPERGSAIQRDLVMAALQGGVQAAGQSGSPLLAFLAPMVAGFSGGRTERAYQSAQSERDAAAIDRLLAAMGGGGGGGGGFAPGGSTSSTGSAPATPPGFTIDPSQTVGLHGLAVPGSAPGASQGTIAAELHQPDPARPFTIQPGAVPPLAPETGTLASMLAIGPMPLPQPSAMTTAEGLGVPPQPDALARPGTFPGQVPPLGMRGAPFLAQGPSRTSDVLPSVQGPPRRMGQQPYGLDGAPVASTVGELMSQGGTAPAAPGSLSGGEGLVSLLGGAGTDRLDGAAAGFGIAPGATDAFNRIPPGGRPTPAGGWLGGGRAQPLPPGTDPSSLLQPVGGNPADPAQRIVQGLVQRGVPEVAAIGIAANWGAESGFDPGINERNPVVPGSRGGFGGLQWTGPRRRQLEAFAQSRGVPVNDEEMQLDFLVWEMRNSEAQNAGDTLGADTPEEAAFQFMDDFLRPGVANGDHRMDLARMIAGGEPVPYSQGGPRTHGPDGMFGDVYGRGASGSRPGLSRDLLQLMVDPNVSPELRELAGRLAQAAGAGASPLSALEMERAQLQVAQERVQLADLMNPDPELRSVGDQLYSVTPDGTATPITEAPPPTFRAATPEEAAAYGARAGQIDEESGRFYPSTTGAADSAELSSGLLSRLERRFKDSVSGDVDYGTVDILQGEVARLVREEGLSEDQAYNRAVGAMVYEESVTENGGLFDGPATERVVTNREGRGTFNGTFDYGTGAAAAPISGAPASGPGAMGGGARGSVRPPPPPGTVPL